MKTQAAKPRKISKKMVLNELKDAVVDNKFLATVGSELVVERHKDGKAKLVIVKVKQIGEDGLVQTWDETAQQWFHFSLKEALPKVLKILV